MYLLQMMIEVQYKVYETQPPFFLKINKIT